MSRTERSKFRAHCKAEADRFDASDTPASRAVRAARERQAKSLRTLRRMIAAVAVLFFYVGWKYLEEMLK